MFRFRQSGCLRAAFLLLATGCTIGPFRAAAASDSTSASAARPSQASLEAVIDRLIQQLGAEDYARREKAQAELKRLGLAAFDALLRAQDSEDIEIALRARYLLRGMTVRWVREDDPLPVKEILRGYQGKSPGERQTLMDQLAALPDLQGTAALCRLVRFETSNLLSKRAALLLMHSPAELQPVGRSRLAATIARETGLSKRPGARWLRVYVETLDNVQQTLPQWEQIAQEEHYLLDQMPEKTSREIVRDLLRWQIGLLDGVGRSDEAAATVRKMVDLVDGTAEQILETVNWLMEREAWASVEELAKRFPEPFHQSPMLLYRLAEAQKKQGHEQLAEQTAELGLRTNQEDQPEHVLVAYSLQQRGLFDWAQREYRHVMELGPVGSLHDIRARFLLSEMLHDLQRELPAAQVLKELADVMENDKNVAYTVTRMGREPGGVLSRMHFFFAEHYREQGDVGKQMEQLEKGLEHDPTDADVLIAMYRVEPATNEWKDKTRQHIAKAVTVFRDLIRQEQRHVADADDEQQREWFKAELASANNQLAWLIANTEGDVNEAVRCSHRSLELRPDRAGYLDTLGRCYYANGDFEKAIKYQSEAVKLEPHSGQIRRQLELFQRAAKSADP